MFHAKKFKTTLDELKSKMLGPPATTVSYATGCDAIDQVTTRKNGKALKPNNDSNPLPSKSRRSYS